MCAGAQPGRQHLRQDVPCRTAHASSTAALHLKQKRAYGSVRHAACLLRLPDQSLSSTEPLLTTVEWLRLTTSGVVLPLVFPLLRRERLPKRSSLQISAGFQTVRLRQTWSCMAPMSHSTALCSDRGAERSSPVSASHQADSSRAEQGSTAMT